MIIFNKPEQWLEYYYNKYKIHFRVQTWYSKPNVWTNYKSKEYVDYVETYGLPNHREIFPDEVVLDIDVEEKDNVLLSNCLNNISKNLLDNEMDYTLWESGGDGFHFHLFFSELLNYNKFQRTIIKKEIKKFLGKGWIRHNNVHVCMGNPVLIQLETAKHRKGGIKKFIYRSIFNDNKIPKEVLKKFNEKKDYYFNKKFVQKEGVTPKEILFLEQEDFANVKDGRNRALFVLAAYYSKFMDDEKLFKKLKEWNKYSLNNYLSDRQIRATIKSIKREGVPLFPYRYLNDLLEELGFNID